MGVKITAVCSVCRLPNNINVTEKMERIQCLQCSHSVPNFKPEDLREMKKVVSKKNFLSVLSFLLFLIFIGASIAFAMLLQKEKGKILYLNNGEQRIGKIEDDEGDTYTVKSRKGGITVEHVVKKSDVKEQKDLQQSPASVNIVLPIVMALSGLGILVLAVVADKTSLAVEF